MRGIRQQASLTITIVTVLILGLGLVGWYGLDQTSNTVTDFEANNLPEISTALSLSESVAHLAALAPYVAGSAKPFQLQSERDRLETRFRNLENIAQSLKNLEFREALSLRLLTLHKVINELIERVKEELFLREDLLAVRFTLADLERRNASSQKDTDGATLDLFALLQFLLDQMDHPLESQRRLVEDAGLLIAPKAIPTDPARSLNQLAHRIIKIRTRIQTINQRKSYLLASVRAQSEQLTEQVKFFVGNLQREVARMRQRAQSTVTQANTWMLIIAGLLVLGMLHHYISNYRMMRDLSLMTQDMSRLAEGDTHAIPIAVERRDEIGKLAHVYNVFRDHSLKIKEVSDHLAQQKELLETIFNHMMNGISVFSPDRKLVWWNRRYLEIFNLNEEEIYNGRSLEAVQALMNRSPHENRTLSNAPVDLDHLNDLRHNRPQTFERHYTTGKVVEFRSQPMPDGGFVTLYSDLTDRKAVEAQLRQAQKMEMLGQLTGGVAHDFNNLLTALIANLQLLAANPDLDEKQQRYANRSLSVAERGANLVHRLLAFSRTQQLHPERLNIDDLITGMTDLIEYSVSPNIEVSTDLNAHESVFVDPSQLENALLNLAINSSAAMLDGGRLTFITETRIIAESETPCVVVTVEDTGHGIPLELQERVLEPFFTTKPAGQGSGMGLSMVYGFVKQSGGEMLIDSAPGKGSRTQLILPISEQSKIANPEQLALSPEPVFIPDGKKVLVVEDDAQVRQGIHEQIESLGYPTISVASAESAMDLLQKDALLFALVLTDISLTGPWSGIDLKHQLQTHWPDISVVLNSGMPRESLEQHYGLQPHDPLILKPVSFATLKHLLLR